jgi:hypothetical protein
VLHLPTRESRRGGSRANAHHRAALRLVRAHTATLGSRRRFSGIAPKLNDVSFLSRYPSLHRRRSSRVVRSAPSRRRDIESLNSTGRTAGLASPTIKGPRKPKLSCKTRWLAISAAL